MGKWIYHIVPTSSTFTFWGACATIAHSAHDAEACHEVPNEYVEKEKDTDVIKHRFVAQMKRNWQSLIKFEISLSENMT